MTYPFASPVTYKDKGAEISLLEVAIAFENTKKDTKCRG